MHLTPLTAGEISPGEVICTKGNGLPGFLFKNTYLALVLLGSQGLAEWLLCGLHVQTKIKLLICIPHLLMKVLFCIYQQVKI